MALGLQFHSDIKVFEIYSNYSNLESMITSGNNKGRGFFVGFPDRNLLASSYLELYKTLYSYKGIDLGGCIYICI